jgi:hypothetical protein
MALKTASANRKDISTAQRGVSLEHRHFSFIAATLKSSKPASGFYEGHVGANEAWHNTVLTFSDACSHTNEKFNRARFLSACGVED